ncbi:MAG: hypothetical protein OEY00_10175, partial [Gammaproteobacteria bacterium]|nr:hypothetical protein [Gammaproteobacteria bacterium]
MNNLQRTTFSMVLGGAIMLMSGIVTTVVADYMRFPATICQLWGGDREHTEALSYSQFGRLENTHGSQRIGIVCPIPLHNIPIVQNVIVYYDDNNPSVQSTGTLSCRLRNNNIWGTSSNESQGRNTGNDADGLAS